MRINLDESFVKRIGDLREARKHKNLMLHIQVKGGGCAGFRYDLTLTEERKDTDLVFGDCVITDKLSMEFLDGATIYYEQNLAGSRFKIKNPNAESSCGCGESFSA